MKYRKVSVGSIGDCPTVIEMRKDTETLRRLSDLEEVIDVPPERGGLHFSDWERNFVKSVRQQFDDSLNFSQAQRDKIEELWREIDLKKRSGPTSNKPENLFSKLSPERQAEQRARAARVKLPWEN